MRSQEYHYGGTATAADSFTIATDRTNERDHLLDRSGLLPFLSLMYVLNGNHDPKKVQRLNIVLSILFFAGGLFFHSDLLSVGFLFAGIALVNGANYWYIQNYAGHLFLPVRRNLLTQIELWTERPVGISGGRAEPGDCHPDEQQR